MLAAQYAAHVCTLGLQSEQAAFEFLDIITVKNVGLRRHGLAGALQVANLGNLRLSRLVIGLCLIELQSEILQSLGLYVAGVVGTDDLQSLLYLRESGLCGIDLRAQAFQER